MAEVQMYVIRINVAEVATSIMDGSMDSKVDKVKELEGFEAVNLNGLGPDYNLLIFDTEDNRDNAFDTIKEVFNSAEIVQEPCYVDEMYLQEN